VEFGNGAGRAMPPGTGVFRRGRKGDNQTVHTRRILIAIDDAHARAWVEDALGQLDASIERVAASELRGRLATDAGDLAVVDAGGDPERVFSMAEDAVASGSDVRLLVVVGPESLDRLRLPVRLPADFVTREASRAELIARARNLLWPGEEVSADEVIRIDDLTLNLATYQAAVRGVPIEFTYLEYSLFMFLVTHPNRVYSREVLLKRVWGTDYFGGARTVDVHVRRIRSKLGPETSGRLETVRNVGYLWRR